MDLKSEFRLENESQNFSHEGNAIYKQQPILSKNIPSSDKGRKANCTNNTIYTMATNFSSETCTILYCRCQRSRAEAKSHYS